MFANLLGQKAYHHLTNADMARIIGVSRSTFCQKLRTGGFGPEECRIYCHFFHKPFSYLFATDEKQDMAEADAGTIKNSISNHHRKKWPA